nr:MAG TPA: hypothetical protein [Caudoviricetes sp.]
MIDLSERPGIGGNLCRGCNRYLVNRLICYAFIVADPAQNIYTAKSLKQLYIL